ncbi:MAG: chemotaxis protein CheW [Nanobdellota archaeon]
MLEQKKEDTTSQEKEYQLVICKLNDEEFGINIFDIMEIIPYENITPIPNTSDYIEGVVNLRGSITVIIDLAKKLNVERNEIGDNTRIVVIEVNNSRVGLIVDSATEVLRIKESQIENAPELVTQNLNTKYIKGVGVLDERLLILLDLPKVLKTEEIEHIQKVQKKATVSKESTKQTEKKSTEKESDDGEAVSDTDKDSSSENTVKDSEKKA